MQENKQIAIVVGLVFGGDDQLLLARRIDKDLKDADGRWELPGGKIEFGEDPETAIIREVREESGLDVKVVRLLPKVFSTMWEKKDASELNVLILAYECKVSGGELHTSDFDHKIAELKFIDLATVSDYDLLKKVPEIIEFWKETK